ncbi:MAG: hypothetical protein C5B50_00740 [Verrucomicrobia bacterium]|nr:MAG: hypothetical protein C5B50_00740 [Verrucomicrobiota bacterium]
MLLSSENWEGVPQSVGRVVRGTLIAILTTHLLSLFTPFGVHPDLPQLVRHEEVGGVKGDQTNFDFSTGGGLGGLASTAKGRGPIGVRNYRWRASRPLRGVAGPRHADAAGEAAL